jgi:hypothetical protein
MASKKITELNATTTISGGDLLVVVTDPTGVASTKKMTITNFFANVQPAVIFNGELTVANNIKIPTKSTPANTNSLSISQGSMFYDANYLYVATANNTVKRVALTTF